MALHTEVGKTGEELAVEWLVKNGFTILERNWRYSHYEIDIIAMKNGIPHFIEVKTLSSPKFSHPENKVKNKKLKDLIKAADEFLYRHRQYKNFHIDILSITIRGQGEPEFFFIEDVY